MVHVTIQINVPRSLWNVLDTPQTTQHSISVDLLECPHKGDIIDLQGMHFGEPVTSLLKLYGKFLNVTHVIHKGAAPTGKGKIGPAICILADLQGGY